MNEKEIERPFNSKLTNFSIDSNRNVKKGVRVMITIHRP